jgi:hypothetical protein
MSGHRRGAADGDEGCRGDEETSPIQGRCLLRDEGKANTAPRAAEAR